MAMDLLSSLEMAMGLVDMGLMMREVQLQQKKEGQKKWELEIIL
jgi:hypothetical protein